MKQALVVDGSPVIRRIARSLFERMEFGTSEASDGKQALLECQASMPDVVFVDNFLSDPDSGDFIRELRKLPSGNRPKILLCATENSVGLMARAKHVGANGILLKPFDRKIFEDTIANLGL